jgi:hypothetical protein
MGAQRTDRHRTGRSAGRVTPTTERSLNASSSEPLRSGLQRVPPLHDTLVS